MISLPLRFIRDQKIDTFEPKGPSTKKSLVAFIMMQDAFAQTKRLQIIRHRTLNIFIDCVTVFQLFYLI